MRKLRHTRTNGSLYLAKVGVEGSNPFARSKFFSLLKRLRKVQCLDIAVRRLSHLPDNRGGEAACDMRAKLASRATAMAEQYSLERLEARERVLSARLHQTSQVCTLGSVPRGRETPLPWRLREAGTYDPTSDRAPFLFAF